jgi:hypothetical protein
VSETKVVVVQEQVATVVAEEVTPLIQVIDQSSRVVVEPELVRIISVGVQGPPGGRLPKVGTPTWASTVAINWTDLDVARLTLAGATTLSFSGAQDGQRCLLEVTQDGVGGRTVTLPASVKLSDTIPNVQLSTGAGKRDRLGFLYNAATNTYDLIALAIGF